MYMYTCTFVLVRECTFEKCWGGGAENGGQACTEFM